MKKKILIAKVVLMALIVSPVAIATSTVSQQVAVIQVEAQYAKLSFWGVFWKEWVCREPPIGSVPVILRGTAAGPIG